MNRLEIRSDSIDFDFHRAKRTADAVADAQLGESICLSWYDRQEDRESPAHASDCHGSCEVPGYVEYAMTRGGELIVVIQGGTYEFCYRPMGEFA